MKIYVTAIIKAKEKYRNEVLKTLQNMVVETRNEKACELYDLHQGSDDKNLFVFYEIWENQEGINQHNLQPYIAAFGELINEKLQEQPIVVTTNLI